MWMFDYSVENILFKEAFERQVRANGPDRTLSRRFPRRRQKKPLQLAADLVLCWLSVWSSNRFGRRWNPSWIISSPSPRLEPTAAAAASFSIDSIEWPITPNHSWPPSQHHTEAGKLSEAIDGGLITVLKPLPRIPACRIDALPVCIQRRPEYGVVISRTQRQNDSAWLPISTAKRFKWSNGHCKRFRWNGIPLLLTRRN